MKNLVLQSQERKKQDSRSAFDRMVPAIMYGHGIENRMVWVDQVQFDKIFNEAGESTIIDLKIGDEKEANPVLVYDIQYDPVKNTYRHIDFMKVKMDEEIEADVEVEYVGEAPAVKEQGGVLVKNINHILVRCLPADLPSEFKVDISALKNIDDAIHIKDLNISEKVKIDIDPETVVALITPPRSEKELEELEEKVEMDIDQVEGIKKEPEAGEQTEGEKENKEDK